MVEQDQEVAIWIERGQTLLSFVATMICSFNGVAIGYIGVLAGLVAKPEFLPLRAFCGLTEFHLDKNVGSASIWPVKIPEFQPSENFICGVKLSCLVARVKNSAFSPIAQRYVLLSRKDPECKIYLRVKSAKEESDWLRTSLVYLFEKNGVSNGVTKVLQDFMKADVEWACEGFEGKERHQVAKRGLAPYFRIDLIVLDEVEKKVLVVGDTESELFHEHGECIRYYRGRWQLDEWGDYSYQFLEQEEAADNEKYTVRWNAIFSAAFEDGRGRSNALYGVWRFSPGETVKARRQSGVSKNALEDGNSQMKDIGWYFAPAKFEALVSGYTADKWTIKKYRNQGNRYDISTKSSAGLFRSFWCDGEKLVPIGSKDVFTRVRKSYRKGKMF